jgi:hypothetical protein
MQTFETQAVISLVDRVSGPLKGLAAATAAAGRHTTQSFSQMTTGIASATGAAAGAISAVSTSKMYNVGKDMDAALNDMRMFTTANETQVLQMQKHAQTKGAWAEGGPVGFVNAQVEALKAGAMPELANMVAEYGSLYARMAHQDTSHGTRELIQHANMMKEFRNSKNEIKDMRELTEKELEHSLKTTLGRMAMLTKNTVGWKMEDSFNYFKNAGPAFVAMGKTWNDAAAFGSVLAKGGFSGEVAGNAMSSILGGISSPKGPVRQALASANIDWSKYAKIDYKALTPQGYAKGIEQRVGSIPESTKTAATKVINDFHANMIAAGNDEGAKAKVVASMQKSLIDVTKAIGTKDMRDQKQAGNFVKTFMANAVKDVDLMGLLKEAQKVNNLGFFQSVFGRDRGKQAMSLDFGQYKTMKELFDSMNPEEQVEKIVGKYQESFERANKQLSGSWSGAMDAVFTSWKPQLTTGFNAVSKILQGIQYDMSETQKQAVGLATALGAVVGPLLALKGLKNLLSTAAPAAAGAPAATGVAGWLASATTFARRFGYVGAAYTGYQAATTGANVARVIGNTAAGQNYIPRTSDQNTDLDREQSELAAQIASIRAKSKNADAADMLLRPLLARQQELTNRMNLYRPENFPNVPGYLPSPKGYFGINGPEGEAPAPTTRGAFGLNGPVNTPNPLTDITALINSLNNTTKGPVNVEGNVTGEAKVDLNNRITIEPSPYFQALIEQAKNVSVGVSLAGKLGTSMGGSSGVKPSMARAGTAGM